MKLYNIATDKIGSNKTIKTEDGTMYPNKLTDAQLNAYGYYRVKYESMPNRNYYNATKSASVVGSDYVVGYTVTEKPLEEVIGRMVKDWSEVASKKEAEPILTTTLGITVRAGRDDLDSFERGAKRNRGTIRDYKGVEHMITPNDMTKIAQEIEDAGEILFDLKFSKLDEIMGLSSIAACIDYENTPYDYIITQEDIDTDIDSTLILGQTITKYSNKVKEW